MIQYVQMVVGSAGPLLVIEIPSVDGEKLNVKWRDLLKSVSALMRIHGVKKKDISFIERIESGFKLRAFWIYRLDDMTMTFTEVKKPETE